jgi:hypothetical protein
MVKFALVDSMKAQRGSKGIAQSFRPRWVTNALPGSFYARETYPVPII